MMGDNIKLIITAILGALTWPSMEYFLHRFLGHELKVKTLFRKEHQTHHTVKDFFAPAIYKAFAAIGVVGSIYLVGGIFIAKPIILTYAISFTSMYLFYEYTHYSFHKFEPKTRWGAKMRKHHFAHHFVNANQNFGVTTDLFDRVLKTEGPVSGRTREKTVRVPSSHAMNWLKDPNGQLKNKYEKDYRIS